MKRVVFDEDFDDGFEILTDPNFPGQFRVIGKIYITFVIICRNDIETFFIYHKRCIIFVGNRIEKVVETTSWDYYEAVQRFQRIMEAQGINKALKEEGARDGVSFCNIFFLTVFSV